LGGKNKDSALNAEIKFSLYLKQKKKRCHMKNAYKTEQEEISINYYPMTFD